MGAQTACDDAELLALPQRWVSHGLFFELLRQYKAAPHGLGLRESATKVIRSLRALSLQQQQQQQQDVSDTPAGIRAALAIAADIEAWLADLPAEPVASDGVVVMSPSPLPTLSAPTA